MRKRQKSDSEGPVVPRYPQRKRAAPPSSRHTRARNGGKPYTEPFSIEPPQKAKPAWRKAEKQTISIVRGNNAFEELEEKTLDLDAAIGYTIEHIYVHALDAHHVELTLYLSTCGLRPFQLPLYLLPDRHWVLPNGTKVVYSYFSTLLGTPARRTTLTFTP